MTENDYPRFLSDEPHSSEDSKIAEAIKKELYQCKDGNSGKIIGLLGSWGSGKSSIIEGIKKLDETSEENKNSLFFLEYDAWKNEKYPFKLGFLKYLIDKVNNTDKKDGFEAELKGLQQVVDTQEKKEYALINFPNMLIASSLLFYPLAFKQLLDNKIFESLVPFIPFTFHHSWIHLDINWTCPLIIFSLGILILSLNSLLKKDEDKKEEFENSIKFNFDSFWGNLWSSICTTFNQNWLGLLTMALIFGLGCKGISAIFILFSPFVLWLMFNFKNACLKISKQIDVFYILAGTTPETKSIITVNKTPEPSFESFSKLYKDIIGEIQKEHEKQNIVIVVDNIDRIEVEEAKSIWASLKGMILKEIKCLNIIIPIDEEQVSLLYKNEKESVEDKEDKAYSFIQKTFDITFRVPPFILSKSEELWKEKLTKAFRDGISENDISEILNIFETRNNKNIKSSYCGLATPRKIIKLINEVVSLQKIAIFNDIPLVTKFAFCLYYKNIKQNFTEGSVTNLLPNNNIIFNRIMRKPEILASLYYAVSPKEALIAVKYDDIVNRVEQEEFLLEEDATSSYVWILLSEMINKKSGQAFSTLMNVINNIKILNSKNASNCYNYLIVKLLEKIISLDSIDDLKDTDDKTIINMLKIDDSYLEGIIVLLYNLTGDKPYSKEFATNWLNIITKIIENIARAKSVVYNNAKYIPENLYKEIIAILSESNSYKVDTYMVEPGRSLKDIIENEANPDERYKYIKFYINNPPDKQRRKNWEGIMKDLIVLQIVSLYGNNPTDIYDVITTGMVNFDTDAWKNVINSLSYYNLLHTNFGNKSKLGKGFAIYLKRTDKITNINAATRDNNFYNYGDYTQVLSEKAPEFIENFANTYIKLNDNKLVSIFDLPSECLNKPQIIKDVLDNKEKYNISVDEFFEIYNKYSQEYSQIEDIYSIINKSEDFATSLNNYEFSSDNVNLLYFLLKDQSNISNLKQKAQKYLDSIDTEEKWESEISSLSINFKIAVIIDYQGEIFKKSIKANLPKVIAEDSSKFMSSMKHELPYLKEQDKKYLFINKLLDENILDNYDFLLDSFSESINRWLKKDHNIDTIYPNFIDKITNDKWIIGNEKKLTKYVVGTSYEQAFIDKWKKHTDVLDAYSLKEKLEDSISEGENN